MVVGKRERIIAYVGYLFSIVLSLSYGVVLVLYGDETGGSKWFWDTLPFVIPICVVNELSSISLNRKSSQNTDGSFNLKNRKKLAALYKWLAYLWGLGCVLAISWELAINA